MHVPLIFRHPGRIAAGNESELLLSNYDFLPTLLDYLGLGDKTPAKPPLAGHSYAKALAGKPLEWDDVMFFEYENTRAVRTSRWKYISRFPKGPEELYDLGDDPSERRNLADASEHFETKTKLQSQLKEFFDRYADPRYDLTRDGTSKAPRRSAPTKAAAS
jgi:arylsulfatase A-like enzyme